MPFRSLAALGCLGAALSFGCATPTTTSAPPAAAAPAAAPVASYDVDAEPPSWTSAWEEEEGSTSALPAATPADQPAYGGTALLAAHGFAEDHVAYLVYEPATGRTLAWRNAKAALLPASLLKVPTALMALEVLGPNHRFRTRLVATGVVRDGVLDGDLYLVGGGDPLLAPADLARLIDGLVARGVRRMTGAFRFDESWLTSRLVIDPAQPEDAGYNPGVSALSLAFNRIRVRWRRHEADGRVDAVAVIASDRLDVPVENFALAPALYRPDEWQAFSYDETAAEAAGAPRWRIDPRQKHEGEAWLPVKRPAAMTAAAFRSVAAMRGIDLPLPEPGVAPDEAWMVARHDSPPLIDIVQQMLEYSNNLTAELVGLAAVRASAGQALALEEAAAQLAGWLRRELPETDWHGLRLVNFSGLSTVSRMSARQLGAVLQAGLARSYGGRAFQNLLPFRARPADELLREPVLLTAKSGTMDYARTLAGVADAPPDRQVGFVLLINDPAARMAYDADPQRRAPWVRAAARDWLRRARALEDGLLRVWLDRLGRRQLFAGGSVPVGG